MLSNPASFQRIRPGLRRETSHGRDAEEDPERRPPVSSSPLGHLTSAALYRHVVLKIVRKLEANNVFRFIYDVGLVERPLDWMMRRHSGGLSVLIVK
ncbi:hypothetical protein [Methylobacterium tarhaniae]|uniref:hypothetical protein n=1 Tax=Methylobacterium tarhaniae TaxID=1187852 RepID=UPI0012ECF8E9|nr:hypothetical protein [Methylobacterium tarhaniae]